MNSKTILIFLTLLLFLINYQFLDSLLINYFEKNLETFIVQRVIDGDTVVINNKSVRLLGINTPEKGEKYYQESKKFLEKFVLNKKVKVLYLGVDKYRRDLAYIFINEKNINLEIVENGFANYYFPSGKDEYYNEFILAWKNCLKNEKNLCFKSRDKCSDCVKIQNFDPKKQIVIFYNKCKIDCNLSEWSMKDEGRKNFVFKNFILNKEKSVELIIGNGINTKNKLFWKKEDYVWTKTGDTLFLRDKDYQLVLWEKY